MQIIFKKKNLSFTILLLLSFLFSIFFDFGKGLQVNQNSANPNSLFAEQSEPLVCGGWESIPCPKGYYCKQDPIIADGYGICKKLQPERNNLQNLLSIRIKDSF